MLDPSEQLRELMASTKGRKQAPLRSSSDGSLSQLFPDTRGSNNNISNSNNNNNNNSSPHEQQRSCWDFESTTPMTTRPHFFDTRTTITISPQYRQQQQQLELIRSTTTSPIFPAQYRRRRKSRSSSVGAHVEADDNTTHWEMLLVPNLIAKPAEKSSNDDDDDDVVVAAQGENEERHDENNENEHDSKHNNIHVEKDDKYENEEEENNSLYISVMYGMINASIVLPVLMSFASIIYRHDAFSPYMPVLVKLTVFSGLVHQVCFSTFSSLPFAVGQVQDAGLIFLASMTTYMVEYCRNNNDNDDDNDDTILLATVTVSLSLCTAILGVGLILVGRWQLAQYVQLLPTSVVGGYLAFIGWFCGESGLRLMAGPSSGNVPVGQAVVQNWPLVLPGMVGGIFIYTAVRRLRHMAVLPSCILLLLLVFYACLWSTGTTVQEATDRGWIRAMDPPPVWYKTWDYLRLDKVAWSVLPNLLLTELGMIFVVALSSSLDVAAIELELKRSLDYNKELTTVGISNLVSGCTGGYTGSYIFSQTIFSLRAGIRSRTSGYVLALCQFIVLVLPFPLLSYVPNFFFGSLLVMICVDLLYEWLWDVRTRVTVAEYVVDLMTFGLIQWLGVEYGIIAGVGVYLVCRRLGFNVGDVRFAPDVAHVNQATEEQHGLLETIVERLGQQTNKQGKVEYGSLE